MDENIFENDFMKITKEHKVVIDMDNEFFDGTFGKNIFISGSGLEIMDAAGTRDYIGRNIHTKKFFIRKTTDKVIG